MGLAEIPLCMQVARLWLSCQGSVSPLHYDAATSFLTQVCPGSASGCLMDSVLLRTSLNLLECCTLA